MGNVTEFKIDRNTARKSYVEYLRAVKATRSREDEALKNAYREISRGGRVLDLAATIKQAGVDHLDRPKLAIVRADKKLCWFSAGSGVCIFRPTQWSHLTSTRDRVALPFGTFGKVTAKPLRAVVPTIPPHLRPDKPHRYWILWEADWEEVPVDPFLLKSLGNGLYLIVAQWNLTELERAVLRNTLPTA